VAQGPLITGGFVAGGAGNGQTLNHPTVGRIPDGAIVEAAPPSVAPSEQLHLQLKQSDFTTASRVVSAINERFPEQLDSAMVAQALSAGLIAVRVPELYATHPVEFVAELEAITVEADRAQKVVINERTGTIVLGKDVRITPVAILQGALSVEVRTRLEVSQPQSFAGGDTTVVPNIDVTAAESQAQNIVLEEGASVEDLVRALQAIGSTSRDIIAVLQNMRAAGALAAQIDVI
jgi:flagellar P-ring protein precursor FlgI